jgi:hypothetical protein
MFVKRVKQNATKAVVWLAVVMFALPATPALACNCIAERQASGCECSGRRGLDQSDQTHSCCLTKRQHSCHSHDGHLASTCCNKGSSPTPSSHDCSCGSSCTCMSGRCPVQPAEPLPLQEGPPNKVVLANSHAGPSASITQPTVRPSAVFSAERVAFHGSLECCIFLSRFTL